ncbi:hypothetical protein D3C71_1059870 [compost metagenome]
MQLGELQVFQVAQHFEHGHRALLVLRVLGMLEWQVDESAQLRGQFPVQAFLDGAHGVVPGQPIGRVRVRGATEAVARELVQQHLQRQGAVGRLQPLLATATGGQPMQVFKALAELRIKGVVAREPTFWPRAAPEVHHPFYRFHCCVPASLPVFRQRHPLPIPSQHGRWRGLLGR